MGRRDYYRLGELEQAHGILIAHCRRCSNRKMFYATELALKIKPKRILWNLRFKCSNCGSRRVDFHPYVPLNMR